MEAQTRATGNRKAKAQKNKRPEDSWMGEKKTRLMWCNSQGILGQGQTGQCCMPDEGDKLDEVKGWIR